MSAYTFYSYLMGYIVDILNYRLIIGNSAYSFIGIINTSVMITLSLYIIRKLVK